MDQKYIAQISEALGHQMRELLVYFDVEFEDQSPTAIYALLGFPSVLSPPERKRLSADDVEAIRVRDAQVCRRG